MSSFSLFLLPVRAMKKTMMAKNKQFEMTTAPKAERNPMRRRKKRKKTAPRLRRSPSAERRCRGPGRGRGSAIGLFTLLRNQSAY